MKKQLLIVIVFFFSFTIAFAQCALGTLFRTTDASTLTEGVRTEIEDRIFAGEYHEITNIVAGNTYTIDLCGSSEDTELTIYDPTDTSIGFSTNDCGDDGSVQFLAGLTGTYKAQLNITGCGSDSVAKSVWATLDINLGTNEFDISQLQVYPNPVGETLNIDLAENHEILSISIMEINGKVLNFMKLSNVQSTKIDMSNISSGIYFLRIQSANHNSLIKLIKK